MYVTTIRAGLWAMVLAVCSVALGQDPAALPYFQQFDNANGKLRAAAIHFGQQWRPVLDGKEPNDAGVRKALAEVQTAYTEVAAQMKQAVPPESAEGQALSKAHQAFLQTQAQIVNQEFPKMTDVALNRKMSLPQRKAELQKMLTGVGTIEQASLPALVAAVTAYVKKYQIAIGPPSP